MEKYNEFLQRINSFEVPHFGIDVEHFRPSDSVLKKVNDGNKFSPYFGDTVVFDLSEESKKRIEEIVKTLYDTVPECFCERLMGNTFHMTLHDLANSPDWTTIASQMDINLANIKANLAGFHFVSQDIRMRTNYIINMVNTSVVLALCPKSEEDYYNLIRLYEFFDGIYKLPYPFTPHITLAYYNRHGFCFDSATKLVRVVEELNKASFDVTLNSAQLYYQRFTSMNDYRNVFNPCDD